jgi:hypothetical protein
VSGNALGENDWVLKTRTVQGLRKLVDYPEVKEVAERLGASPAQVLIAWGASRGLSVVCKSVQKGRWTDRVTLYIIGYPHTWLTSRSHHQELSAGRPEQGRFGEAQWDSAEQPL